MDNLSSKQLKDDLRFLRYLAMNYAMPSLDGIRIERIADDIERLERALRGYGKDPNRCVGDRPCVSHAAYMELLAERTAPPPSADNFEQWRDTTAAKVADEITPVPQPNAAHAAIADTLQGWLDYQAREHSARRELPDGMHIYHPPVWPTRGVIKRWIEALRATSTKSERCPCGAELPPLPEWSMPHCPKCVAAADTTEDQP